MKLKELLEQMENKYNEASGFFAAGKTNEGNKATKEYLAMKEEYENRKALEDAKLQEVSNNGLPVTGRIPNAEDKDGKKEFFNALRTKASPSTNATNAATSGDNESGGYTVPEDIQTRINEFRSARDVLTPLVSHERVTTQTGARTFKKRSQQKGFVEVGELGKIPEKNVPLFTRLEYNVKKYAGFLPASNELLADSDAAIEEVLISWLGNESRITRNKLILEVLDEKDKTDIKTLDDLKKARNVTLDPVFKNNLAYITNQDGFHWLDTLKDKDGRYLLQETIAFNSGYSLFGRPVIILSNATLPNVGDKAPIIIGDLQEAVAIFDRMELNVRVSDVAGDSFMNDSTLFRAIERLDVQLRDEEAFVYGLIPVGTGGATPARATVKKAIAKDDTAKEVS